MTTIPVGVWVVIAAYNEGPSLAETLRGLVGFVPNIVVVDDGSDDDTSTHAAAFPVWLLQHLVNRGQGVAMQTGIEFALKRWCHGDRDV